MVDTRSDQAPRRRFAGHSRSRLALGGLAAAATVSLSACGGSPEPKDAQFTSVTECVKGGFPEDLCQSSYGSALQEYQKGAPRFTSLQSCEQEWGSQQCVQSTNVGNSSSVSNIFVPMLAGFVVMKIVEAR